MTYSSSLAMSRQRFAAKNQNTASFRAHQPTIGPVSNTIMLIILACLLGLLYLTQVTKANAFSYRVNDLKEQQSSLQAEQEQLVIDAARLQSLERARNSAVAKSLVSVAPSGTVQN